MNQSLHLTAEPTEIHYPLLAVQAPQSQRGSIDGLSAIPQRSREDLILEHLPLVRFVARKLKERLPQHVEMEELHAAGMIGLIDAADRYDGGKKVQFTTYAQFRIRGAILDSLRALDWGTRDLRRKHREIESVLEDLSAEFGRAPEESEVATKLGVELEDYQQTKQALDNLKVGSLEEERREDPSDGKTVDLPAPLQDDPFFQYVQKESRQRLAVAIDSLPEKERLVLTLRYFEELSVKEIASLMGVVESRVSQLHKSAVLHMREAIEKKPPVKGRQRRGTRVGAR